MFTNTLHTFQNIFYISPRLSWHTSKKFQNNMFFPHLCIPLPILNFLRISLLTGTICLFDIHFHTSCNRTLVLSFWMNIPLFIPLLSILLKPSIIMLIYSINSNGEKIFWHCCSSDAACASGIFALNHHYQSFFHPYLSFIHSYTLSRRTESNAFSKFVKTF